MGLTTYTLPAGALFEKHVGRCTTTLYPMFNFSDLDWVTYYHCPDGKFRRPLDEYSYFVKLHRMFNYAVAVQQASLENGTYKITNFY